MTAPRIGSLFTGTGGLDMAVEEVFGARTVWVSDIKPAAVKLLAHRLPGVPNLGDITKVNWGSVQSIDILTGGFPCTDVSPAGKQAGLIRYGDGATRSGLWAQMCNAVARLRPSLMIAENVRGLLSASADSEVEPCPWCVGDEPGSHMRALGAVLADLADIGYDAAWFGLRAADVGACHARWRVFIAAWPSGSTPTVSDAGSGVHGTGGLDLRTDVSPRLLPTPVANDSGNTPEDHLRKKPGREVVTSLAIIAENDLFATGGRLLPTPSVADALGGHRSRSGARSAELLLPGLVLDKQFGLYAESVARQGQMFGRVAPAPTEPNARGGRRLSPAFTEWMMGLPEGHITGVPGLSRNDQLSLCGDGVVPQQAAAAIRYLLAAVSS